MNHELLKVQVDVLLCLVEAHHRHEMAPRVLAILGDALGWDLGVLWEFDSELDGELLVARAQWRSRRLSESALEAETARLRIPRAHTLRDGADRTDPAWYADIANEPQFLRAASARADGLRTAVVTPLVGDGRTLGYLELFRREKLAPDRELLAALALLGRAIGAYLERARSRAELEAALRALDAELQDRESKLAREIHDILGQELTGLKLDSAWVARRLAADPIDPPALVERLEAMSRSIDGVLHTVRRIATDLRAGVLDDLGLAGAIEAQARELAARSGLAIELALDQPPAVGPAAATAVFRAVQELLTNIVRHAGARRASISLREAGGFLELRVRDDGAGIDPEAIRGASTLGLLGIRERALAYGGNFEIAPFDGGTEAVLRLPYAPLEVAR
jgi:signal transduction histidine kinase